MHFFDFQLLRRPGVPEVPDGPDSADLLVLYAAGAGKADFLVSVLRAAGYESPREEVTLLAVKEDQPELDLSRLVRRLGASRVMVFGLPLAALGYHLRLAPYVPVTVNGHWLVIADDPETIRREKEAGQPQKAGLLWKAVKAKFLKSE